MKTLLYIAFKDFSKLHYGANAKVLSQCRAFAQYGYAVDLIGRQGTDTVLLQNDTVVLTMFSGKRSWKNPRLQNFTAKQAQIQAIRMYIRDKQYDACYIRYDFADPAFLNLLACIHTACPRILLELPTYPYEGENTSLLGRVKLLIDNLCRRRLHGYVDRIVTFYPGYDTLFGIPVQVIPNGFDFATMSLIQRELPTDAIHVIAVSSMREWHGYERFIEGLHLYYESGTSKRELILHLVGNGRECEKYKALVEQYGLQKHVLFEGAMHGEALDALYECCAIGIDSLARHRSGIDVLSSLKSREYGAKGLPMINSCKIDVIEEDFPYLLLVPADETPIDIPTVVAFYDRCYATEKSRREVGAQIRQYMEEKSDMWQTLRPVVQYMEQA